jgi:putative transposase
VRPRRKRKVNYVRGNTIEPTTRPNERWSIDFIHDRIENGRSVRALVVVDDFTRECLAIRLDYPLGNVDVIREFETISFDRGLPKTVRFDNGSEFTSHAMLRWGAEKDVDLHFVQPGKPTHNGNVESLNGRIRDELFNMHRLTSIFEAQRRVEAWRVDYNDIRPHSALG